jgi:L-ascorbate metabolism protein UlaG (beta-lactamase superfamily)
MKVKKFGHCCLLIEEKGLRILTDPGIYSTAQNEVKDIDLILITHEHQDHLHIESLKHVMKNNPSAKVITNKSVCLLLDKEGIKYHVVEDGQSTIEKGVRIEGFGKKHAIMYHSLPQVDNTGYFIGNKLFYPGDALTNPGKKVEILALPVAGPWLSLAQAIDYALELKPEKCFPIHEGILKSPGTTHIIPPRILEPKGIKFVIIEDGKEADF